jgi:glucokinase
LVISFHFCAMTALAAPFASPPYADGARLLADIGGTNARFALETAPGRIESVEVLVCAQHPTLAAALQAYLGAPARAGYGTIRHAAVAIANPVHGDFVRMTNHHWEFSIAALQAQCDFATLLVVNDFSALAMALPHLAVQDRVQVGGGVAVPGHPLGLLGAGTGLGVSGLIPCGAGWNALQSEGGHATFAPANAREVQVLEFAWREFDHVSTERLISGVGLELLYRALAAIDGRPDLGLGAADITRRALAGECALCDEVIDTFCGMLGTMAGNVAITLGATGGMYIGGGIVPRLGGRFARSPFRARFEHKGRFSAYLAQVPTYVITAAYPAFLGVSALLAAQLGTH